MSTTINNTTQSNFLPVTVNPIPVATPEDLIYTLGGTADTINGIPGTIFPSIVLDQTTPGAWYHGGNPLIATDAIKIHGVNIASISNSEVEVVSDYVQKGIFELRKDLPSTITSAISSGTRTIITVAGSLTLPISSYVEIVNVTNLPDGYYKIVAISGPITGYSSFEIEFDSSLLSLTVLSTATVTSHQYYWDEVYTTPLGLYAARDTSMGNPNFYEFIVTGNNSEFLSVYIDDPNIIPKTGDSLVIQRFFQTVNSFTNTSTTDGINNVPAYSESETYTFTIQNVTSTAFPAATPVPYTEYQLTLDKSFAPIISGPGMLTEKYMLVLLNRAGTSPNKELITDTWTMTEVHREQLLGDPYTYSGVTLPSGRKNYLNYSGAERLGFKQLLSGIISDSDTPFIVLHYDDNVKDRIYKGVGDVEVHFPTVMIQDEKGPVVLSNRNALNLINSTFTDSNGIGDYSALYMKYSSNATPVRYGWVFYDLRIIVIDHAELAFALSYNSNRNYTLPQPVVATANTQVHPTLSNPLTITAVSGNTTPLPITITSTGNHNFKNGDEVFIEGVLGNTTANTVSSIPYYVQVVDAISFKIYQDSLLTTPIMSNGIYTGGGLLYGTRLAYEYFITYRLRGSHYKTAPYAQVIPFNFEIGGLVSTDPLSNVSVSFNPLTHLVDYDSTTNTSGIQEGFEANDYEVIIGKYKQSLVNLEESDGIEDVVLIQPVESLKNLLLPPYTLNAQNTSHSVSYTKTLYDATVASIPGPPDQSYDLLNNSDEYIYNLSSSLPETLFTAENIWNIGLIKYKQSVTQYKLTFEVIVPADKWNSTQNPSYETGNLLMTSKFISEIEFLIEDANNLGDVIDSPYVYAKISPVLRKTNDSNIVLRIELDF